jgi:xylulose-5-phosphate/fructose-6-phosphate phosphoketolase
LGYALGVAHGHALSAPNARVIAVLGDGELETAPTAAALQAFRVAPKQSGNLTVVVNLNGFRMGGPSHFASWSDDQIRAYFDVFGFSTRFVSGFDVRALLRAIESAMAPVNGPQIATVVVLKTLKGATAPPLAGEPIEGTSRAHKVPLKKLRTQEHVRWLEDWLRSYRTALRCSDGRLDRADFEAILPDERMLIGRVRERTARSSCGANEPRRRGTVRLDCALIETFADSLAAFADSEERTTLLTSPDELSSNRLEGVAPERVETIEYLSEHQCLSWTIGSISAGRQSWFATYDAFAPMVLSMVVQYARFLDNHMERAGLALRHRALNIVLTSLGWRNVYSHQDPGFISSLLERRLSSLRCFLPISSGSVAAAVAACAGAEGVVNCIAIDKHMNPSPPDHGGLACAPYTIIRESRRGESVDGDRLVTFLVIGDYLVREALAAADALACASPPVSARVVVIEELTWLYRAGSECDALRARFRESAAGGGLTWIVSSLYGDVVSALLREGVGLGDHKVRSFAPVVGAVSPAAVLLSCGQTWPQLAADVLGSVGFSDLRASDRDSRAHLLTQLQGVEKRLRRDLGAAYDDPEWYWRDFPQALLAAERNR